MSSPTFLRIDQQSVSIEQVWRYLQLSGQLQPVLLEILHQYALEQALQTHSLTLSPETFSQSFLDFRLHHQLLDPDGFQTWLRDRGLTPETFLEQFRRNLLIEQLKAQISQPKLQSYFEQNQFLLEQVVLSGIISNTYESIEAISQTIQSGTDFDQIETLDLDLDAEIEHHQFEIRRADLPETLRAAVDAAAIGATIGPLELEDGWWLFRVEGWQPAQLDDELKHQWQAEIFDQWLADTVQTMTVELQVNNNDSSTRSTGYSYPQSTLERSSAEFAHQ
ncbi:MAG: peptidylprolyl isomerase [Leptolyngbyaceae cyanobacterium bins.349]|nr:peptidylprolyl isomerase [Leptolyngbyaceae cyanobacterium bins.349]